MPGIDRHTVFWRANTSTCRCGRERA